MEINHIKIIETIAIAVIYLTIRYVSNKIIDKTTENKLIYIGRAKVIKKVINLTFLLICATMVFIVWGVNQADLAAYLGSILTVVGVAFFAQWSILSNITSSIIIFFYHSIKLEDNITIMEGKEYEIDGKISNISLFFVTLKTKDNEEISLPNNIFIQKMIKKKPTPEPVEMD